MVSPNAEFEQPETGAPSAPPATIDSAEYQHTFYGILNGDGKFWTPIPFDTEKAALTHLADWSRATGIALLKHTVVPVRIRLTTLPEPAGERFFIDHGMIHDRVTGRHVTTAPDDEPWNGGTITSTCALLNSLAMGAISDQSPAESQTNDMSGSEE